MKNKHTLANRNKINKVPEHLNQIPLLSEDMLPGKDGETFQVELNQHWFGYNEDGTRCIVDSKVYTKWWQRLLNKITFGLYKPTTFWYKVKPVDKSKYTVGIDPYTSDGEGSMGAIWDDDKQEYIILPKKD